jgi:hypothetical protein
MSKAGKFRLLGIRAAADFYDRDAQRITMRKI